MTYKNDKKIKIMHITRSLNLGGLERVITILSKELDKTKFEVSICCLLRKGYFAEGLEKEGVKIYLLNERNRKKDYFLFFKLARLLKQVKPDIIHTHNTHALIDGTLAGIMEKVSCIIHTDHARQFPDTKHNMILERLLSKFVFKIVAVSQYSKNDLIRYEKMDVNKIQVIYNGVPNNKKIIETKKLRDEFSLRDSCPILGYVGRLSEEKGCQTLLAALPKIVEKFPQTKLLIVGDGPFRRNLEKKVKIFNLTHYVQFFGKRVDVDNFYQIFDIYILPSFREGLPLSLLEAMSHRNPVIASDVGGIGEVIEDGKSGFLIESGNSDLLAEKVTDVLIDKKTMSDIGERAFQRYCEMFNVENMVKEYETLYIKGFKNKNEER